MMKRYGFWAGAAAIMLVAACSDEVTEQTPAKMQELAEGAAPVAAEAVNFENNELRGEYSREFKYTWPAEVTAIPDLAARFSTERDAALAEQKTDFEDSLREFGDGDCIGCVNRSYEKAWAVVTDLPRFLSLSASIYFYTGGAHGNAGYDALVWDREADAALQAGDFFTSPAALQSALGAGWCAQLKKIKIKRLGEEYADDTFFGCPDISELTVLLGSSNRQAFNRIGLIAAPYVAGSYAEGTYEVTLPVTPKLIEVVKPEYRAYFAPAK